MTLDTFTAMTPDGRQIAPGDARWWLNRLSLLLNARDGKLQQFRDYYEGRHNLRFADKMFREAFGSLFKDYAENVCELVVDSCAERLHVTGFRMGSSRAVEKADDDAWEIWQENKLDAQSQLGHKGSLITGESYVGVWSNPKDDKHPLMRILDSRSTIVVHVYEDPLERRAALRRWRDDWTGRVFATVYLPDGIYKYQAVAGFAPVVPPVLPEDADRIQYGMLAGWEQRTVKGEPWPLPNPLGVVPIVPLLNKPSLGMIGFSEIATTIPINDAINKLVSDMLVTAGFAAFPQRYGINLPLVENEETGEVEFSTSPIDPGSDRLWAFGQTPAGEEPPKFGEFTQASLDPFVKAIEQRLQMIATITRTPHHYILGGQGSFPSGEALRSVETPLVSKARDKMLWLGEAWEEAIRLAFAVLGDPKAKIQDSETIWRDPETRTDTELADSLVKLGALGVPRKILWERYGFSPVEIERIEELIAEEEKAKAKAAPPPMDPMMTPNGAAAAVAGAEGPLPVQLPPGTPAGAAPPSTTGASSPPVATVTDLKVRA